MLGAIVAEQLRGGGHDVVAVTERRDLRGLADADLFAWAQRDERALVTYNREDYLALDRAYRDQGRAHHGIVILHPRRFPHGAALMGALVGSLAAFLSG